MVAPCASLTGRLAKELARLGHMEAAITVEGESNGPFKPDSTGMIFQLGVAVHAAEATPPPGRSRPALRRAATIALNGPACQRTEGDILVFYWSPRHDW